MKERTRNKLVKLEKRVEKLKENIWNIPNALTLTRVLITLAIIYTIFFDYNLISIVVMFIIGMITDFLDGNIARIFNMKTEFGRKFDMLADRFLFVGAIVSLTIYSIYSGKINNFQIILIGLIASREIIGLPFGAYSFFTGKKIPHVRVIGKITTVLQAVTFPVILLNLSFSPYLAVFTGIAGLCSGILYAYDTTKKKQVLKAPFSNSN